MKILFIFLLLLFYRAGLAQQDSAATSLKEVVVTAQRTKQESLLVPYSVQTVTQSWLTNSSPRTTPEALTGVNGVFVQKTNHGGGSPFIRGLTGNQTLILIDGIRLNNSTFRYGPNQYLNTIDAYTIEHIELAKGTGSVQYGTDALGGVVHVITKEPQLSNKSFVRGKAIGKYSTGDMEKTVRGEVAYASKDIGFIGGITYRKFGDLIGGDTTGKQIPSGYSEWSFNTKAKFVLKKNMQLTLANQYLQQQNVPVYHKVVLEDFAINGFDRQQRMLHYARLNRQGNKRWNKEMEIIASWQQSVEERESQKNGSALLRKERDQINTIGVTTDIFSEISKAWTANSGLELFYDKVNSSRKDVDTRNATESSKRGLYPDQSKYGNYSLYSLHHFSLKKWILDAGIRFNSFSIRILDTSLGKVTINPSALVGNVALLYKIARRHHVYITLSNGYRAPNIDDMGTLGIVDFRYELPTTALSSEKSANMELGYKFSTKKFRGTVALYHMRLTDLITRVKVEDKIINGYPVYKKENSEDAFIRGLETECTWNIAKTLELKGGVAYAYGQNNTKQEPLRRIPPLNGNLMSNFHKANWFAAAELLFASKQDRLAQGDKDDNRIPAGGTPGWKVVHLYAGYEIKFIRCTIGLQNIFNEDYRTHGSGINGAGRNLWLSTIFNL